MISEQDALALAHVVAEDLAARIEAHDESHNLCPRPRPPGGTYTHTKRVEACLDNIFASQDSWTLEEALRVVQLLESMLRMLKRGGRRER